jgi:hypothetical protein
VDAVITGTFTVETSDDATLVVGESYPLSIDDTTVTLAVVTTSVVTATGSTAPGATTTPDASPTDAAGGDDATSNEVSPGVPAADEVDTGLAPGETPAPGSTPPATA